MIAVDLRRLLPQMGRLRYELCPSPVEDMAGCSRASERLEHLPYCLFASAQAIHLFSELQYELVLKKVSREKRNSIGQLQPEERCCLGAFVDLFLDSARRAQNAIIPCLQLRFRELSGQLPKSLSRLAQSLEKNQLKVPPDVSRLVLKYWSDFGAELKAYRDLAQHWAIVTGDARVFIPPEGEAGLIFLLPSNPEVQSSQKLKFGKPPIHAFEFMIRHFLAMVEFTQRLSVSMLQNGQVAELHQVLGSRPTVGTEVSYVVPPTPDEFITLIEEALDEIGTEASEPLPTTLRE